GLTFRPAENAARRVWAISGTARLDSLKLSGDPSRIRTFPGRFDDNRGTTRTCIDCRGVPGRFGPVGSFRVRPSHSAPGTRIPERRGNHVATESHARSEDRIRQEPVGFVVLF